MTTTTLERREQPGVAAPTAAPGEPAVAASASQMPDLLAVHAAVLAQDRQRERHFSMGVNRS